MISKQGDTLQGVTISQGNAQKDSGVYKDATTFYCHADGALKLTWIDDSVSTLSWVKGDSFPVLAKSIEITSGTFSIGWD